MPRAETPKARALAYLQTVLDDPNAARSDRQRAAEAILRADAPQAKGLRGAAAGLSDAELEATARGEGGRPPERGPATGVTETGPIRESAFAPGGLAATPTDAGGGPQPHSPKKAGPPRTPPVIAENGSKKGGPKPVQKKMGPPPPRSPSTTVRKYSTPYVTKRRAEENETGKMKMENVISPPEPIRLNPISPNLTSATISDEDPDPCT